MLHSAVGGLERTAQEFGRKSVVTAEITHLDLAQTGCWQSSFAAFSAETLGKCYEHTARSGLEYVVLQLVTVCVKAGILRV